MSQVTYFVQECPTCGRRLEIRVEYMGRRVACQHCHGQFLATDQPESDDTAASSSSILRRANSLIELLARKRTAP